MPFKYCVICAGPVPPEQWAEHLAGHVPLDVEKTVTGRRVLTSHGLWKVEQGITTHQDENFCSECGAWVKVADWPGHPIAHEAPVRPVEAPTSDDTPEVGQEDDMTEKASRTPRQALVVSAVRRIKKYMETGEAPEVTEDMAHRVIEGVVQDNTVEAAACAVYYRGITDRALDLLIREVVKKAKAE